MICVYTCHHFFMVHGTLLMVGTSQKLKNLNRWVILISGVFSCFYFKYFIWWMKQLCKFITCNTHKNIFCICWHHSFSQWKVCILDRTSELIEWVTMSDFKGYQCLLSMVVVSNIQESNKKVLSTVHRTLDLYAYLMLDSFVLSTFLKLLPLTDCYWPNRVIMPQVRHNLQVEVSLKKKGWFARWFGM
jgi:hypothetical protein